MKDLRWALKQARVFLLIALATPALSQSSAPPSAQKTAVNDASAQTEIIPERILKFSPVESDPAIAVSPLTSAPQCGVDGSLILDTLDSKDPRQHTVISIQGKKTKTYSPSAISDLHDIFILGVSASESTVGFLVRGTRETSGGPPGHGRSPAGFTWSSYHNYVAEFNRDGSYKGSIELPTPYQLSHLAIFPSGEFLVSGYDQLNSTARLLLLDSSGQVSRTLDMPAARTPTDVSAPYGSIEDARASRNLIGSLAFTSYGQDILVWRGGSSDPILDIGSGGGVREVPLQVPSGFVFVGMVPANDRWIAHFRLKSAVENSPFSQNAYSYYELRPQDASISSKLLISGDVPQFLACESDGNYITYKLDKDNKMVLYSAN